MTASSGAAVPELHRRVVIVGAGPAGLSAATTLARRLGGDVLVLEREAVAGGIPRHCDHPGFGIRDQRRFLAGPAYARRLVERARSAGVEIRTSAMVTGWDLDGSLRVTSPSGLLRLTADAIVLATGARERPRSARLVPGDRPAGVLTTGQLQNLVQLGQASLGSRAVVVGTELVSWSAVLTLRSAGVRTALMVTGHDRPETFPGVALAARAALRVPVATGSSVAAVTGRSRVESVEILDRATGSRRTVPCDTVVFTGDWIPDNELARAAGLTVDPASGTPVLDASSQTSRPGVYAVGNLVNHPVRTADSCALAGRRLGRQLLTAM